MVKSQRFLSRVALFACFFALSVIALGAFTRLVDAGLGCPDWPGCYGKYIAPTTESTHWVVYKAWAEMIHRYFVAGLSTLILMIVILILSQKNLRRSGNLELISGLILLTIYQIALGRWTVTLKLLPIIVTQHLLGGFLILSLLWLLFLNNQSITKKRNTNPIFLCLSILGIVLLFLQISLGAWTSTNYASLSCPDFPFCQNNKTTLLMMKQAFTLFTPVGINYEGGVLPDIVRQTIQMTHRFGALIVTLYLFIFSAIVMLCMKNISEITKTLHVMLGLLVVQVCIGISNVIFKLPLLTAISHTLVAALLLLSIITMIFKLTREKVSR